MVLRDILVALCTIVNLPWPIAFASQAANMRLERSLNSPEIAAYFSLTIAFYFMQERHKL
jgi:hypothetical protein